ncbi:PP2C family protein-serine/threonine phosphatase [Nocardioides bruguierae]|uniref:Serine/threonine-protein phosphatase n=1 Tax=Nocardioides bruguierae TaxID=2945102 RepID=A0A9X2IFK1_9ACTN|nr:PP2C family protein-serine/threonine phosphatase [Nocardioides bruguierae]MCL8026470.1 serine/threonine-protein phosphatase [Nocardioides bruguierae]MCM0619795.1 serine/threonine-protein phosphatase [Nocardioides bruguierae]
MTIASESVQPASHPRGVLARQRRWVGLARDRVALGARRGVVRRYGPVAGLVVLSALLVVGIAWDAATVPMTTLMVPLLVGSLVLAPRHLAPFVGWMVLMVMASLLVQPDVTTRILGAVAIQLVMCGIVLATALNRVRLGVPHLSGDAMFVDLRDRLLNQGSIPDLCDGWSVQSALVSASGTRFAGDFLVAARVEGPDRLELALVDVSGKGDEAGTRALQLSGAFGGLLGSVPSEEFLSAANAYLLRQDWAEGFATAVHLRLDLADGTYELRTAGHPSPLLRSAGTGRWRALPGEGPILGLVDGVSFGGTHGTLERGDSLVLYTDGMVEEPRRDIELGVDRLAGAAESLLRRGVDGAAQRVVDEVGAPGDDRAVVWVHRR